MWLKPSIIGFGRVPPLSPEFISSSKIMGSSELACDHAGSVDQARVGYLGIGFGLEFRCRLDWNIGSAGIDDLSSLVMTANR